MCPRGLRGNEVVGCFPEATKSRLLKHVLLNRPGFVDVTVPEKVRASDNPPPRTPGISAPECTKPNRDGWAKCKNHNNNPVDRGSYPHATPTDRHEPGRVWGKARQSH